MKHRGSFLLVLAGFPLIGEPAAAQPPGFSREDSSSWVRRQQGIVPVRGASRLKVVTQGRLVVQSSPKTKGVEYLWVHRIPLRSGVETAEAAASGAKLKAVEQGEWCIVATTLTGDESLSELTVTVPESFSVARLETRAGSVKLSRLSGDIHAATGAGNVDLDTARGDVVVRTGGGVVNVGTVHGTFRCLSSGGTIRVQEVSGETTLETAGGEVYVQRAGGPARLSTAGGNIRVGRASGDVFAHTAAGSIEVGEAGGIVTAETGSGGIQVGKAQGARCESGSGMIRLQEVSGSIRAATVSGSVFMSVALGAALGQSFLATNRGDITVFLPSTLAVTVRAMNESAGWVGRLISEFEEIKPHPVPVWSKGPLLAEGSLNGGGSLLMLSTSNGLIAVKRRK